MAGVSVLIVLGFLNTLLLFITAIIGTALASLAAGIVVAIVFACRTGIRARAGKQLNGLVAIPVVLIGLGVHILALCWFILMVSTS